MKALQFLSQATALHHHEEAGTLFGADLVYATNVSQIAYDNNVSKMKYIHVVSSDFAYPAATARLNRDAGEAPGQTEFGPFDGASGTIAVGQKIHGGFFGNQNGLSATISSLDSGYSGGDATVATITSSTAVPSGSGNMVNNTRFFFGDITGKIKASFAIAPGSSVLFKKLPSDKIFSTPGINASSGNQSSSTAVFFTKVSF